MAVAYHLKPAPSAGPKIDYAAELNPEQLAAATAGPGPSLVLAGAGSGKTRTLTYRVAYLAENGLDPERILLLTFTNKASREMMRRVEELLPLDMTRMWGGTFHHVGHKLLRRHASLVGLQPNFNILDRVDAKDLLAACIPTLGFDPKERKFPKADAILELLSFSANTRKPITDLLQHGYGHLEEFEDELTRLASLYTQRKLAANAVDYDDLLLLSVRLLTEHPDVGERYRERWLYVLVDEYQDTNQVQADLIDAIASGHRNIMAVGDDAQSIYSWRGANFANILSFPERYPGAKVFRIETNYRSIPEILEVANASILCNTRQYRKELRPVKETGMKPALVPVSDAAQQAQFVAQRVLELRDEGMELEEMAVLYRAHSHALELQLELTRRGVPFQITSGMQFFEQAHLKDVAAILRISTNPFDEISFKRIVKLLPGVGDRAADKLWTEARGRESWMGLVPPKKAERGWKQLAHVVEQLRSQPIRENRTLVQWAVDGFYEEILKLNFDNHSQRLDDLRQLQEFSSQFETLEDFLAQMTLMTGVESAGVKGREKSKDSELLKLSTVHQAKGLEWKVVFIIMLCDGTFPLSRCLDDPEALEEERRLFYVAITRAREELYLLYPSMRFGYSNGGDLFQRKSRFLHEISEKLLDVWSVESPF